VTLFSIVQLPTVAGTAWQLDLSQSQNSAANEAAFNPSSSKKNQHHRDPIAIPITALTTPWRAFFPRIFGLTVELYSIIYAVPSLK
jgi:hypothetical protein